MFSLIMKDLYIQKRMFIYGVIYTIIVLFFMSRSEYTEAGVTAVMVAITYLFMTNSCVLDERNKADIVLNSLPLSRSRVVGAKYLSILVYITLGFLYFLVFLGITTLLPLPVSFTFPSFPGLVGGCAAVLAITSLYLPIYHRYGFIKSRIFNFILFFGVFFVLVPAANYLSKITAFEGLKGFFRVLDELPAGVGALVTLVFFLLLFFLSFLVSRRVYQKREF